MSTYILRDNDFNVIPSIQTANNPKTLKSAIALAKKVEADNNIQVNIWRVKENGGYSRVIWK